MNIYNGLTMDSDPNYQTMIKTCILDLKKCGIYIYVECVY